MTAVISEIKRVSEVYLNFTHSVHFHSADSRKRWLCKRFPHKRYARAEDLSEQNHLLNLMMEKPDSRKCHSHTVLVACLDDVVVTD